MSNVYDFEFYKKRKEEKELKDNAAELLALLDSLMVDGESFMVAVEDEEGNREMIDVEELMGMIEPPDNDNEKN
jgi:hypothetical protein